MSAVDDASGDGPTPGDDGGAEVIVGVGASAGDRASLDAMLRRVTLEAMAIVVVQGDAPDGAGIAVSDIQRATPMPVEVAADGTRMLRDRVYVAPPGARAAVLRGVLHLMPAPPEGPSHPVDLFFRSLAEDRGARAIGVVFEGAGADGALGLAAIRAAGGLTFAQRPAAAELEGAPPTTPHGDADLSLSPEDIADELTAVSRHPYLREGAAAHAATERLGRIFVLLRDAFGHDLSLYKHGTIERRVERRMALLRIDRLDDYVVLLQSRPSELASLYRDLLIGVTSFFRDQEPFEALKTIAFPRIVERGARGVRVWVPGCSTGEEAYSIAISLLEFFGERAHEHKIQVFGTDVDDEAVQFARRGLYPPQIAVDVSAERLRRFFTKRDGGYQVSRTLRDIVVFARHDVTRDPPFSRIDLVSCRNVLIYFQAALQKKVLRTFQYALSPEGLLLLGSSESVGDSPDLFSPVDGKVRLYRKKHMPSTPRLDVAGARGVHRAPLSIPQNTPEIRPMVHVQQLADRRVLERFGPPGVVIDESFEVLQFRGRTGPFLEPQPGAASLNLLKLARPELVAEIRAVVHRALETNAPAAARRIAVRGEGARRLVDVEALPIVEPETRVRSVVVLFVEEAEVPAEGDAAEADPRLLSLERELSATKEFLQSSNEELQSANEELQSANEELQSANEELQSTNEELETSKEELQSANEELTTVNDELQRRMSELGRASDDLQNLLAVVEAPIVIVGIDLRIRSFSRAAERLLNLAAEDLGRPVAHLSWFVPAGALERLVGAAIERLANDREEFSAPGGARYSVTASPYKTGDHAIRGAVLTFASLAGDGVGAVDSDGAPARQSPTERGGR